MPRTEQFLQFLTLISGSATKMIQWNELLIPLLSDKIRQENGNPYSDSNLKDVLKIARFGIIDFVSKNDKTSFNYACFENEGENDLGQIILDSLVRLRFENDPYIIDMLFDYTQVINESNEGFSQTLILWKEQVLSQKKFRMEIQFRDMIIQS